MKKINSKKLLTARSKYENEIQNLERELSDFIDFDFSIFHQASDGLVILRADTIENTPLDVCISIINEKGMLSYEDYKKNSI